MIPFLPQNLRSCQINHWTLVQSLPLSKRRHSLFVVVWDPSRFLPLVLVEVFMVEFVLRLGVVKNFFFGLEEVAPEWGVFLIIVLIL